MIRHKPLWLDRFPNSRRPSYPRLRGQFDAPVVIVGGGLTGAACALSFGAAGIRTIVLEADRIGGGATAGAVGFIREDFDASFRETAEAHGLRAARLLWQGMRRAALDFSATLRRLQIRCDLAPQDLWILARDSAAAKALRKEYQARREAGLDHTWITAAVLRRQAALDASAAIRTRAAVFDPYRACLGLAAAASARGAAIHEGSSVERIKMGRKHVEVSTKHGMVRAAAVIVATAARLKDLRALRRHFSTEHSYAVVTEPLPAAVRRELGSRTSGVRIERPPPQFLRWMKDDRVMFAGADQPEVPSRLREKVLVQRTGELMYELSVLYPPISGAMPEWSWDLSHEISVDGLPCIGVHRNFPRHLFALGHGRHGAATAWLAARVLLRHFRNEPAKGDELFGFGRIL
jgi:glycine/D-amino acid oxidase-like deaminating enzyme